MDINEMKVQAPEKGIMYALFRSRVIFRRYRFDDVKDNMPLDEVFRLLDIYIDENDKLLELHMFDDKQEYRIIYSRRKGYCEYVINDENIQKQLMNSKNSNQTPETYIEEVYCENVEDNKLDTIETVKIVNYIDYDENDLLKIKAYRLKEVK